MKTYEIGTKYESRHKTWTVIDILKTYNSKNELVKLRYVATHQLMGQPITDYDVVPVTISRGLFQEVA